MPRNEVRVVVLYEDDAQGHFVRRLVQKLKLRPERLELCGDCNRVLSQFRLEVEMLQRKKNQRNLKLIVVIDADDSSRDKRLADLEGIVGSVLGSRSGEEERIAFVIPAWEIETWYVHLCCPEARPIDESRKDYKSDPAWKTLLPDLGYAAKRAVEVWQPEKDRLDPPSLVAARDELQRLT